MKYDMQAINLEKIRIGSSEFDALLAAGWRLLDRLIPVEYNADGTVYTNYFMMYRDPITPNGGAIDLTEVWETIGDLGLSQDALNTLVTNVQLRVAALEQMPPGGGADFSTHQIPVEIWSYYDKTGELRIQPEHAINLRPKYTFAYMSGNTLVARFTIGAGGDINYGNYLIKPIMNVSGYAAMNPLGQASYWGAKNGFTLQGQSMWKSYGGEWFIRMSSPTYDYLSEHLGNYCEELHGENYRRPIGMAGGDRYWRKGEGGANFPWNSFGGDVICITIQVFPL